jgi:hypothetical protein
VGDDDDEGVYHLESHPLRPGEYVTLTEPDGRRLPFRVVQSQSDIASPGKNGARPEARPSIP